MNCPSCGSHYPDDASFCPNCGTANPGKAVPPEATVQTPVPYNNYDSNIEKKNIALCIIFSIITCGIYGLYWIYTLTEDTKKLANNPEGTSGGMVILFSLITCGIYSLYWLYKQGDYIDRVKRERGIPSSNSGLIWMLLAIFGLSIISYALMQNEINDLAG